MNEHQTATLQNYPFTMPTDFLSKEEVDLLKRTMLSAFEDDEKHMFIRVCQRTRLDPFTKQVYPTRRYVKSKDTDGNVTKKPTLVTVTGIMGLCAVAERTGHYDGCEIAWSGPDGEWKTEWLSEDWPAAARCIVYHKTRKHPEVAIARWFSFVGQSYNYQTKKWEVGDFWEKMPDYMLSKCAKAAALRGAFPDQLSNVYIREELDSDITDTEDTEAIPADEAKIAFNQRREAELKASGTMPGVKWVEQKQATRPTATEALEPAFPEDKIPEKPKTPAQPPKEAAAVEAVEAPPLPTERKTDPYIKEPPDDLDMSSKPPEPAPVAPAEPAPDLSWQEHVIKSVQHPKFEKRPVGTLNQRELVILESQWLPLVLADWDQATEDQQADAKAFQAAIAFSKAQKPW